LSGGRAGPSICGKPARFTMPGVPAAFHGEGRDRRHWRWRVRPAAAQAGVAWRSDDPRLVLQMACRGARPRQLVE
jgi:hypothetical protein